MVRYSRQSKGFNEVDKRSSEDKRGIELGQKVGWLEVKRGVGEFDLRDQQLEQPLGNHRHSQTLCQKFRKGVGGQKGLARRDPSCARYSDLFSVPFFLSQPQETGNTILRNNFRCVLAPFRRQPPPANPFSRPLTLIASVKEKEALSPPYLFSAHEGLLKDDCFAGDKRPIPPELKRRQSVWPRGLNPSRGTKVWYLAHQNRTIAIPSDFRVDGARPPEFQAVLDRGPRKGLQLLRLKRVLLTLWIKGLEHLAKWSKVVSGAPPEELYENSQNGFWAWTSQLQIASNVAHHLSSLETKMGAKSLSSGLLGAPLRLLPFRLSKITQWIPKELFGITEVTWITPVSSLRCFWSS